MYTSPERVSQTQVTNHQLLRNANRYCGPAEGTEYLAPAASKEKCGAYCWIMGPILCNEVRSFSVVFGGLEWGVCARDGLAKL